MVFEREVLIERLDHLSDTLDGLRPLRALTWADFSGNYLHVWAAERGLQVAAETVFDMGSHVLANHFQIIPEDYKAIIRGLGEKKVISSALAERMKHLSGFRNILVHQYLDVDGPLLHDHLQKGLPDFEDFSREILSWMDQQPK